MLSPRHDAGAPCALPGILAALCALVPLVLASCGEPAGSGGPDAPDTPHRPNRVLVIVLDALHARHLSCYGAPAGSSPNIDALAAHGMRFDRALSNNTWTLPSTVSLMTGRLQEHHGIVHKQFKLEESAWTLAELFQRAGWRTAAFVQMAYASEAFGLGQGFDSFEYYGLNDGGARGDMPADVVRWMEENGDAPEFLYLHFRRPHSAYTPGRAHLAPLCVDCPLRGGRRDAELAHADQFKDRTLPTAVRAHLEHLYRANLATVDARLRPVIARALADEGTLVVLLSDHGDALGEHGYYGHGDRLLAENVDIPLIFEGPGIEPGVDSGPASTVDLLPTLLELCDLALPPGVELDGQSLAPRLRGEQQAAHDQPISLTARYGGGRMGPNAIVRGRWKLVLDPDGRVRLFDRRGDPGDLTDVAGEHADVVLELQPLAEAKRTRYSDLGKLDAQGRKTSEIDADLAADLEALGYAAGADE